MTHPQVVRVYSTYQDPDYECPWQSVAPRGSTGSGVIVGRQRILTGAHVVANATFLQVQKPSHPDKAIVRVRAVCHDADLALLEIIGSQGYVVDTNDQGLLMRSWINFAE